MIPMSTEQFTRLSEIVTKSLTAYMEELVKREVEMRVHQEAMRIIEKGVAHVIYKEIRTAVKRAVDVEVRLKEPTGESGEVG